MTKFYYPIEIKKAILWYIQKNNISIKEFVELKIISKPTYYKYINEETRFVKDSTIKWLKKIGAL